MSEGLSEAQWQGITDGRVTGPAGVTYLRRSTRLAPRQATAMVEAGCPVLAYLFSAGQLDWHDAGAEAQAVWAATRGSVTDQEPKPRRRADSVWTAGRWESEHGDALLVLTGHC